MPQSCLKQNINLINDCQRECVSPPYLCQPSDDEFLTGGIPCTCLGLCCFIRARLAAVCHIDKEQRLIFYTDKPNQTAQSSTEWYWAGTNWAELNCSGLVTDPLCLAGQHATDRFRSMQNSVVDVPSATEEKKPPLGILKTTVIVKLGNCILLWRYWM